MNEPRTLGPWLRRFLAEHIVTERNLARNTRPGCRDAFVLPVPFISARVRKPADRLTVDDLSSRRVLEFLAHLEDERGCSVQTRNLCLSAIRAFARFVASRDPAHLEWSSGIRAITVKKAAPQPIGWLARTEMMALIDVPDRRTPRGRVEHALLPCLYNTGARVSESTALLVRDLELGGGGDRHALATLLGKGGKRRLCPLWPRTEGVLAELARRAPPPIPSSRAGIVGPARASAPAGTRTEERYTAHDSAFGRLDRRCQDRSRSCQDAVPGLERNCGRLHSAHY